MIKTKVDPQIQQISFLLDFTNRNRRAHPRSQFSQEEDNQLAKLVDKYGEENWEDIAKNMRNRNIRQCKDRWINYLSPNVKKSPWTQEEDDLLEDLHSKYGAKWVKIAHLMEGRTDTNLKNRYLLLQRHKKRKEKLLLKQETKNKQDENICLLDQSKFDNYNNGNENNFSVFVNDIFDIPLDVINDWDLYDFD